MLRYTVQKYEVFNGRVSPMCQDRQGSCGERRTAAFDSAAHSTPLLIMKISATSYADKRGVHSLFGKWRINKHHIG